MLLQKCLIKYLLRILTSNNEESDYATVDYYYQKIINIHLCPAVHKNEDVQSNGEYLQDVGHLYAVVDKNAKNTEIRKTVQEYIQSYNEEENATIECKENELHDTAELYATV